MVPTLRYNLRFRDLMEMMEERGLSMAHTTCEKSDRNNGRKGILLD